MKPLLLLLYAAWCVVGWELGWRIADWGMRE
jgi:hypothetical protein